MTAAEPLSAEELADIRECVAADKANQLVSAQWLTAQVARLLAAYDALAARQHNGSCYEAIHALRTERDELAQELADVVAERDRLRAELGVCGFKHEVNP